MKRPREHEVIVGRQLAQTGGELALVDQPTGLIDDCEGEDGPEGGVLAFIDLDCWVSPP